MQDAARKSEGLREQKRIQTLQRISEVGLKLFVAKGYEATTLDEIAAAAGISRRTFFYYFDSKEDILVAYVDGYADALKALVLENASSGSPLNIVRDALVKLVAPHREAQMLATARIVRQSQTLRARNQGKLLLFERAVFEGLCELWPKKDNRDRWRLVAMMSMGTFRLAVDAWIEQDGKRPLAKYFQEMFRKLQTEDLSDAH
jgi:AcrR family transcriptional regulator